MKLQRTMPFKVLAILSLIGGMLLSCGSTSKTRDAAAKSEKLDELISEKSFEITSDQALPMTTNAMISISNAGLFPPGSTAGQINLIGNPNYLRVMGDSVSVYLPYFGERQMGGGYNNDGPGIQFEGIPEKMEIAKDGKKRRYNIRLRFKDDSEMFNVMVTLFANLSSTINVNSSQRFPIRYQGRVETLRSEP